MIWKYVLKSFRRRRVRSILMILSLIISTGLIVAMSVTIETMRRSTVDLIAADSGRYDLVVSRAETSPEAFVAVAEVSQNVLDADARITAVYPRFQREAELTVGALTSEAEMLALDPAEGIGQIEAIEGEYQLGDMQCAIVEPNKLELGDLQTGDTVDVAYHFPRPREAGTLGDVGSSQRRAVARFTVGAIVRQSGVAGGFWGGVIVHIEDAQAFLGLPDQAKSLIALVNPGMYDAGNAETAALSVRDVAINVQAALGDQYTVRATKARALGEATQVFMILQALVSVYGLMSLSVVGLLVYTLVMTNVKEQRRELAILRILGSKRKLLFGIVIVEVVVIGLLGVGLGVILGQIITMFGVVPLIEHLMRKEGLMMTLQPTVSLPAILPAIISAAAVLLLSAIKPAQDASKTKVVHAINPGVADNIQLEDLDQLRERRPNRKLFYAGVAILLVVLLLNGQNLAEEFGLPAAEAFVFLSTLALMVVGMAAVFFILTRPLERLVLRVTGPVATKLTFFAARNVGRSSQRNTLISLLVLLSGVMPSFLATGSAISHAKIETDIRRHMGAPVRMQTWSKQGGSEWIALSYLRPSFLRDELPAIPGIDKTAGLTDAYEARVSDAVEMRGGTLNLIGVSGDLSAVLYEDLMVFVAGGPAALAQMQADPGAIIISQGMAEGLAVHLGGTVMVEGEGLDHREELTVVGIVQNLPGFNRMGRSRRRAMDGGTALISLDGFRRLTTEPQEPPPAPDERILRSVLATLVDGADPFAVEEALHGTFDKDYDIGTRIYEAELGRSRKGRASEQILLLVLTMLSFITAVFGVFAVIYVTIYSRRQEIGMMKAIGARKKELNGMLCIESIAMTLGAALAGILAGSAMAYVYDAVDNAIAGRPQQFALDTTVTPFVIVMVVLASVLGTVFSAKRIIKRRAVEILRMS